MKTNSNYNEKWNDIYRITSTGENAMIEYELPLDENMGESFPGMTFEFPYVWIWGEMDKYIGKHVPWHWHDETEFVRVLKGEIEYHLPGNQVYVLKEGDAMFLNTNVLHMICAHDGCQDAVILPQIFNRMFFIGYNHSVFDNKYYRPIIRSHNLQFYHMHADDPEDTAMIKLLDKAYACARDEDFGYEIKVRQYISEVWLDLFKKVEPYLKKQSSNQDKSEERLREMMRFLTQNYDKKITMTELADHVSTSERECIRCFQKNMQTTPFKYLQEYRIEMAANMLLHTDLPITDISLKCGFATSSHFTKIFKDYMNCIPKEYRNTSRRNYRRDYNKEKEADN